LNNPITLISIGRHTRLGDVLEQALEGLSFQTVETEELSGFNAAGARLLFAASADATGANEHLHALTQRFRCGELRLQGAACAVIADGEQGGGIQADSLKLLLSASDAGAACIPQPLLESRRDLRSFLETTGAARKTPFDAYVSRANTLIRRLSEFEIERPAPMRVRLASSLTGGAVKDWRSALSRILAEDGSALTEGDDATHTILLAENTSGLPDERTLALLKRGSGRLTCLIPSPVAGGELYSLALLDQTCVRGGYSLSPEGMLVFEGLSAVEVLSSKAELERVKQALLKTVKISDS
jgi:hypothetical protein